MQTDYEQWKSWLDKWDIEYREVVYDLQKIKCFEIQGEWTEAYIDFDLDENFIRMTAHD